MSKTQLYIGLDLLDFNAEINIKRQVNDYRDPAIGSSVKSYTLAIPLTKTNRSILGFVDDVRSRAEVSETARLVVNGMEVIRGKFRILSVEGNEARAIIEGSDWVNDISGININDLDWSGDTHTLIQGNVSTSWTAAAGAFYRYPMINFAELQSGDYGTGGSKVYTREFWPMWNIQDIVSKLFLESGYTLDTAGFFHTTFGQALYLMSQSKTADDSFLTGKAMHAYVNSGTDNIAYQNIGAFGWGCVNLGSHVLVMDGEVEDEGSDYSVSTHRYTAPETGTYRFQAGIRVDSEINDSISRWNVTDNYLSWRIRKNGSVTLASYVAETHGSPHILDSNPYFTLDTGYIPLTAGDYIDIYIARLEACGTNVDPVTQQAQISVMLTSSGSYLKAVWDGQNLLPGYGETINPAELIPEIEAVSFLKGLKEAFGLRFFVDRMNRRIYIETSNDFYGSTVVDWTDKIDYSQGVKQEIIAASYKEIHKLHYNPDTSDKAYTNEVAANGVPFQKIITLDSEYMKPGTTEHQNNIFSPTPTGSMPQIGHWLIDRMPRIFGSADFVSSSRAYPANRASSWNPRIFEWKGMTALGGGNWDWLANINDTTPANYTTFPQAVTPDMADMYDDYLLKDWNRVEKNKIVTVTLVLSPVEIMKFMTVVGTAANEGFRATYKLNIEGVDMLFICSKIITDGDRVQAEFIQKM